LFRPDGVQVFTPESDAEDAAALETYFGIVL
jgi:hypothetical protein